MDTNRRTPSGFDLDDQHKLLVIHPELFFYQGPQDKDRILRENAFRNMLVGIALVGAVAIVAMTYFASQHQYFAIAERQVVQRVHIMSVRADGGFFDESFFVAADEARAN